MMMDNLYYPELKLQPRTMRLLTLGGQFRRSDSQCNDSPPKADRTGKSRGSSLRAVLHAVAYQVLRIGCVAGCSGGHS